MLSNFLETAPRLYKSRNGKQKRQILSMIGSNFSYKDGKLSVELTSVFDLLIKSASVLNGAGDEARTCDILLGKEIYYTEHKDT